PFYSFGGTPQGRRIFPDGLASAPEPRPQVAVSYPMSLRSKRRRGRALVHSPSISSTWHGVRVAATPGGPPTGATRGWWVGPRTRRHRHFATGDVGTVEVVAEPEVGNSRLKIIFIIK
ncbi:MAG: hypothetical protein ACRDTT_09945, partial [Pseudonocardiaceae bacterium]